MSTQQQPAASPPQEERSFVPSGRHGERYSTQSQAGSCSAPTAVSERGDPIQDGDWVCRMCLLEGGKDLTPLLQRQAKALQESITQQEAAGALSSCGLGLCGENQTLAREAERKRGCSKSESSKRFVAGGGEACQDMIQSFTTDIVSPQLRRSPFSWVNTVNWFWDARRISDKCWPPAIQINSRQPVGQWPLK